MTGRNANVFYEVGYAHALGKIVLLLTRDASDIPFDLQQQPHTVYEGKIELLRSELAKRIRWAVNEAKNKQTAGVEEPFELTLNDVLLPSGFSSKAPPLVMRVSSGGVPDQISIIVRNVSFEESETVSHIYLFTSENSVFVFYQGSSSSWWSPEIVKPFPADVAQGLGRQYWFSFGVRRLPPGTFEMLTIMVSANPGELNEGEEDIELRFHTSQRSHRYSFKLAFEKTPSP
jgi:hypothetical protein